MSRQPSGQELDDLRWQAYLEFLEHGEGTYEINNRRVRIEDDDCTGIASNPKTTEIDGKPIK